MFDPTTPPAQNPLNPVMPTPGMPSAQMPPVAPAPFAPAQPPVHTMPERFRSTGSSSGGPKGSSSATKKLIITLVIVVVVAGLGVAGLFIFNKAVKTNTNTANTVNLNRTANLNVTTNLNTNTASNVNSVNANTNTTANVNVANVNTTTNVNTTANTNAPANTNTSVSTGPLPSSLDTDKDGLTDVEEAVYGTDVKNADTDGDTFVDGMQVRADGMVVGELVNLYNPKGAGTLEASGLVKRVQNATNVFSLLVPTSWTTNESSGLLVVTPTTQTGEFFQVRMNDNTSGQTLQQWYQTNNPQADISKTKSIAVNGLEGLISQDGANVYFAKGAKVYGLTYTASGLSQLNYWTTFTMMMKSFKLVAAS